MSFLVKTLFMLLLLVTVLSINLTTVKSRTTELASSFAPNGIIYAQNSILRLQGVVKGQYTVACNGTAPKGNIYLDDDITYNSDPRTNPDSKDLLGIVSKNNVQ